MKYIILTFTFLLTSIYINAQGGLNGAQGFPQPSISNVTTYGNIPVGLFTGVPNISIPLYNLELKDFDLPINLNYHIYNVKPNSLPSEVGLGWGLECGGYITRVIKTEADKNYDTAEDIFKYRVMKTESNLLNSAYHAATFPHSAPDTPDEFQFNFAGYSGSFIYNIEKGKWMIQSDSDIKVGYNKTTYNQTRSQISNPTKLFWDHVESANGHKIQPNPREESLFDSFTLTTPDGYKYIFGGTDKTDYNIAFRGYLEYATPVTWHLSKIVSPNGHEVEFKYQIAPLQVNGNMAFNIATGALFESLSVTYNYELIAAVQLSEIIDNTERKRLVSLNYSPSTQLSYDSQYAWDTAMDAGLVTFFTNEKNFTLNQLNSLSIFDKINYQFTYTTNPNERLKLKKISKTNESGNLSAYALNYHPQYLPGYNTGHYDNLGFYNGKDFSYYFTSEFFNNARKEDKQVSEGMKYTQNRMGDSSGKFVTAEMLKSITYPTKGYTEFIYEPNIITQMVSANRKILQSAHLPYPGTPDYTHPGGLRIKQVDNYDYSGELLTRKHYYYTTDFTPEKRNGISSGILSFVPQYLWGFELYNLVYASNALNEYLPYHALMSQSSNPLWYNSRGEYIGYSKVTECNEDKEGNLIDGYTIHTFQNFAPGYMDEAPIAMLNHKYTLYPENSAFVPTPYSPFTPCTSNALKRGTTISKEQFDAKGIIKQKEMFEYTPIQKDSMLISEITYTSIMDYNPDDPFIGIERHAFGGTYYHKSYSYLPTGKQTFVYDDRGNVLTYKNKYEYDESNKMIKRKTTEDENGNIYEEKTRYITEMLKYPNIAPYNLFYLMQRLHFTSYPLETTKIKNNNVIADETFFYAPNSEQNNIMRASIYSLGKHTSMKDYKGLHTEGAFLYADTNNLQSVSYLAYDSYSNPVHIRNEKDKSETVYLYGYKGKYIIAEIKNSDYESVVAYLGNELINRLTDATQPAYADIQKVEKLRSQLTTSFITTYQYIPYVGISQITDPRNVTTYFEYDDFGRLIQQKDTKRHLINSYKYSKNI